MSKQLQFLGNVIESAKTGNDAAMQLLRTICSGAVEAAPNYDLIAIADCLYRLGIEATHRLAERN